MGERTAVCERNGDWGNRLDNCILRQVEELLEQSEVNWFSMFLTSNDFDFLGVLKAFEDGKRNYKFE